MNQMNEQQRKKTGLVLIAVVLLWMFSSCNAIPAAPSCNPDTTLCATFTPSAIPITGEPSATLPASTPTSTVEATEVIPTPDPTPTQIAAWPEGLPELLSNPNFDDGFSSVVVGDCRELDENGDPACEYHIVANGWDVGYMAKHYHPENAPPPDPNSNTPQGRPEVRDSVIEDRVVEGSSQYAFFSYETGTVAFFQLLVNLNPGDTCQLSVHALLWVAGGEDEEGRPRNRGIIDWTGQAWAEGSIPLFNEKKWTSDTAPPETGAGDWESASVLLFASNAGDQDAFTSSRLVSRSWGYEEGDGIYDQFKELKFQFTPSQSEVMVGFQAQFKWRLAHNDVAFDNASLTCLSAQ